MSTPSFGSLHDVLSRRKHVCMYSQAQGCVINEQSTCLWSPWHPLACQEYRESAHHVTTRVSSCLWHCPSFHCSTCTRVPNRLPAGGGDAFEGEGASGAEDDQDRAGWWETARAAWATPMLGTVLVARCGYASVFEMQSFLPVILTDTGAFDAGHAAATSGFFSMGAGATVLVGGALFSRLPSDQGRLLMVGLAGGTAAVLLGASAAVATGAAPVVLVGEWASVLAATAVLVGEWARALTHIRRAAGIKCCDPLLCEPCSLNGQGGPLGRKDPVHRMPRQTHVILNTCRLSHCCRPARLDPVLRRRHLLDDAQWWQRRCCPRGIQARCALTRHRMPCPTHLISPASMS